MLSTHLVPTQIEEIGDHSMRTQKSLSLPNRFESPHTSLSNPCNFMRLLGPVILIPFIVVDRLWN